MGSWVLKFCGSTKFQFRNCGSTKFQFRKLWIHKKKSLMKLLWKHNFSIHELVGPQNFEITLVFPQSCHFGDFNTLSFSAVLGDHCLCRLRGFSCSQCNESHPVTELDEIRLCDVVQRFLQALKWGPFLDGGISSSYPTGWASFVWCFAEISGLRGLASFCGQLCLYDGIPCAQDIVCEWGCLAAQWS